MHAASNNLLYPPTSSSPHSKSTSITKELNNNDQNYWQTIKEDNYLSHKTQLSHWTSHISSHAAFSTEFHFHSEPHQVSTPIHDLNQKPDSIPLRSYYNTYPHPKPMHDEVKQSDGWKITPIKTETACTTCVIMYWPHDYSAWVIVHCWTYTVLWHV